MTSWSSGKQIYIWTWNQQDALLAKRTPEAKIVKARYEAHLTIQS